MEPSGLSITHSACPSIHLNSRILWTAPLPHRTHLLASPHLILLLYVTLMSAPTIPVKSSGVPPSFIEKKELTFDSLLNSPHYVPTLCASESHVLIRDALMCKDSSVSHLQYGLPVPESYWSRCFTPNDLPTWHIYEEQSMTMLSTAPSRNPEYPEPNLWSLVNDHLTEEDRIRERQLSWPESSSLLENRPSKYSRKKNRKTLGGSLSVRPKRGIPSWRSFRLIGTEWCPHLS